MEPNELGDIYRDAILEHCRNPRNQDRIADPDVTGRRVNPFCGDEVDIQISLDGHRVEAVGVQGVGCAINQASASMLSEAVADKTVEEVESIARLFRDMMAGEASHGDLDELGDLTTLSGVLQYPIRIKCALLAWSALEEALGELRGSR